MTPCVPHSETLPPAPTPAAPLRAHGGPGKARPFHVLPPRPAFEPLVDGERRQVRYLRLSVTDRCNFRCLYCMPEQGLSFVPRAEVLSFEELERLVRLFVALGVTHVRLTGGEPLLRHDLPLLVAKLAAIPGVEDLSLSTNGFLLPTLAAPLRAAGLTRVNVSLDTLDPARFGAITRMGAGALERVLAGLEAARAAGLGPIKLNAVVLGGQNDDELPALVRFAAERDLVLRLIEHMPVGLDGFWTDASFVPVATMRERLAEHYHLDSEAAFAGEGGVASLPGGGPARHTLLTPKDGSHAPVRVGFITAVSDHFCATCNRIRLTATGTLQECLAFPGQTSLRDAMRAGAPDSEVLALIQGSLGGKGPGHLFAAGQYTLQSMSITGG